MRQAYLDLLDRQRKEINKFPIAYAFNNKQLEEALNKLGVNDISECVTVMNHGDIMKKEDAPKWLELLNRHVKDLHEAMLDEDFAEAAFLYEMDNHEYAINWDGDWDVLQCFAMSEEDLDKLGLAGAYRRARNQHMKNAEEWGMI